MDDLNQMFATLKALLQEYHPPLQPKVEDGSHFDLWSTKDVVIDGRTRKAVFFASVIIQKGYVGFYYMPVYAEPDMRARLPPELLKLLKGKSCFHIKRLDPLLVEQINQVLRSGFESYQNRGWV